jgi:hypothetical protein
MLPVAFSRSWSGFSAWPLPGQAISLSFITFFVAFAFCLGSGIWVLIAATYWTGKFASSSILRIQPGHADGCCGLEELGACCLNGVLPLAVGALLCAIWANARHLKFFRSYPPEYLDLIVPVASIAAIVLVILTVLVVYLPLRGLHARLENFRRSRQGAYSVALEGELATISSALSSNDAAQIKTMADRLKLLQQLDPTTLKLATWPFDKQSLIKYSITPVVSLLGTLGKEALKLIA